MNEDDTMAETGRAELLALRAALDSKRHHILAVLDDLEDEHLTTPTLPSGWTPLELVRHLTLGDERYWFSSIVGGESLDWIPEGERADWMLDPGVAPMDVIAAYREQIEVSDAVLDTVRVDDPPGRRDRLWEEWGVDFPTVRVILLHMIVETATHAGHLDAAVELIDGRQHLVVG